MKSDATDSILTGALVALLILCAIFCVRLGAALHEQRYLVSEARDIQVAKAKMGMLIQDCLAYASNNPAIDPILESIRVAPPKAASGSAKSTSK